MEAVGDGGMTRLYLIRHAEAEGNLYRVAHGHCNGLITNYRGYQQIDALRERFRKVDIDAVYSSDLYRTQITARAIWLPKALPLHLRCDAQRADIQHRQDAAIVQRRIGPDGGKLPNEPAVLFQHKGEVRHKGRVLPQAVQNKMLHTARAVNIPECIPHKALHGAVVGRHFLPDGH